MPPSAPEPTMNSTRAEPLTIPLPVNEVDVVRTRSLTDSRHRRCATGSAVLSRTRTNSSGMIAAFTRVSGGPGHLEQGAPDGLGQPQSRRSRLTSNRPSATVRLCPPRNKPTPLTRRARHPPANTAVCPSSRIRATVAPLGSPTTRHASSTTRRTRSTTITTRNAVSSRQPSAALANNATTAAPDRPTAIKRVAFPPKCDSDALRHEQSEIGGQLRPSPCRAARRRPAGGHRPRGGHGGGPHRRRYLARAGPPRRQARQLGPLLSGRHWRKQPKE
jgi:hypothetical protein